MSYCMMLKLNTDHQGRRIPDTSGDGCLDRGLGAV